MALPAFASTVPAFTVTTASHVNFDLPAGTTFNGSISTSGTLRIWVISPSGAPTVNLGLVDNAATFGFVAQETGNYTINFENGQFGADPVQVTFTYTTNPDISANNQPTVPLTSILVIVAIGVVGSVLIVVLVRRKSRPRTV